MPTTTTSKEPMTKIPKRENFIGLKSSLSTDLELCGFVISPLRHRRDRMLDQESAKAICGRFLTSRPPSMPLLPGQLLDQNACRSEEHTSELQSQFHIVCRLLLEN